MREWRALGTSEKSFLRFEAAEGASPRLSELRLPRSLFWKMKGGVNLNMWLANWIEESVFHRAIFDRVAPAWNWIEVL